MRSMSTFSFYLHLAVTTVLPTFRHSVQKENTLLLFIGVFRFNVTGWVEGFSDTNTGIVLTCFTLITIDNQDG